MKVSILFLLVFSVSICAFASGDHDEEHGQELPSGVTSFHDEEGEFSLKPNVVNNFGITSVKIDSDGQFLKVPESAVIRSLKVTSIYLADGTTFIEVPVEIIKTVGNVSYIKNTPKVKGKLVVSQGGNFLKTIHLSLEEGPSEGHGH